MPGRKHAERKAIVGRMTTIESLEMAGLPDTVTPMAQTARYNFRFYPTPTQKVELAQLFGCVRVVFNWGLAWGRKTLNEGQKLPSYNDLSGALTHLKRTEERSWLADVSCVPLQQALRHLSGAWSRCFKKMAGRPRFKRKQGAQSAEFTKSAMTLRDGDVTLGRITGPLDIRWSRELAAAPSSCTVSLDTAGRYHISFVVDVEPVLLEEINRTIGIDLGLTHFAITSDGATFDNLKFLEQDLDRLAKVQRKLSRCQKGSRNRHKIRLKVARVQARIADKRRDVLHKLSTQLIRENQAIAVETLSVKNMVRHRSLSRSISDAGWGMFVQMLEYKAEWYGRTLVKIDRWHPSSKMCSSCDHVVGSLPLHIRQWTCQACDAVHDRDVNAARNIKRAAGRVDLYKNAREEETSGGGQLRLFAL